MFRKSMLVNQTSKQRFRVPDNIFAILLIMPVLVVLTIVVLLPILKGIYVSFCTYKLANLNNPIWNNFGNYVKLFKQGEIFTYFLNTFVFVGLTVAASFIIGLCIALLLNTKIVGRGVIRGLFLIPWTIPSVVTAIVWHWMLQQQYGVLNYIFYKLGLSSTINISWTQSSLLAMVSIIMASVWQQLPYMMVMILAALQTVDASLVEAAKIDGANPLKALTKIILPSIRTVLGTAIWISLLQNFQNFTIIWNMTGGGPVISTTTLSIAVYRKAFQEFDFGLGSAIGVLWIIVLFIATLLHNRISDRQVQDIQ
jgi:multiple sugar transport system permease protein